MNSEESVLAKTNEINILQIIDRLIRFNEEYYVEKTISKEAELKGYFDMLEDIKSFPEKDFIKKYGMELEANMLAINQNEIKENKEYIQGYNIAIRKVIEMINPEFHFTNKL